MLLWEGKEWASRVGESPSTESMWGEGWALLLPGL